MPRTFTVHEVRRAPPPGTVQAGRPIVVRITNIDLTCDSCGYRWDAVQGVDLEPAMGGMGAFCPVCKMEGLLSRMDLER